MTRHVADSAKAWKQHRPTLLTGQGWPQENLLLLHKKLDYAEKDDVALTSAALRDVAPELDALRSKAVAKARDFLMARIYALRKPKTNIQVCRDLQNGMRLPVWQSTTGNSRPACMSVASRG